MSMLEGIRNIRDLDLARERVMIRADLDAAPDRADSGESLIGRALPTIRHALDAGARVIVAAHLGRPAPGETEDLGMEAIGLVLANLSGCDVLLPEDAVGDAPKKVVQDLRAGQICLLENLRFHAEEEKNDDVFARQLADLCDVYVGDDLRTARLAAASVNALPKIVRTRACGFLVEKELSAFDRLTSAPARPYVAVLGGAALSEQIALIDALLATVDALCIGGAVANTLLAAQKIDVKASHAEHGKLPLARNVLDKARDRGIPILLPVDVIAAGSPGDPDGMVVDVTHIPDGAMALDIGPQTLEAFSHRISSAKTVFWHGPMGMVERAPFALATMALARAMSGAPGFTVVGGEDSAAAAMAAGQDPGAQFGHVSTSGALVDLLAGKRLAGIEALRTTKIEM